MPGFVISFAVGVICIILGISNYRGNISSLHSYHRSRVAPEDVRPFGKKVGLGTILIGCGVIVFSIFGIVSLLAEQETFVLIGIVLMMLSMVTGMIIAFDAMKKYNHGIF